MTTVSKAMACSVIMLTAFEAVYYTVYVCLNAVVLYSMPERMDESKGTLLVIAR